MLAESARRVFFWYRPPRMILQNGYKDEPKKQGDSCVSAGLGHG
jgi:hypothetical protein